MQCWEIKKPPVVGSQREEPNSSGRFQCVEVAVSVSVEQSTYITVCLQMIETTVLNSLDGDIETRKANNYYKWHPVPFPNQCTLALSVSFRNLMWCPLSPPSLSKTSLWFYFHPLFFLHILSPRLSAFLSLTKAHGRCHFVFLLARLIFWKGELNTACRIIHVPHTGRSGTVMGKFQL